MDHKIPLQMIYDGDCHFCLYWIKRWRMMAAGGFDYASYQHMAPRLPQIPLDAFKKSVHLIDQGTGEIKTGADAVFTALASAPRFRWLAWSYRRLPGFAALSEFLYRFVACRRVFFSKLTRVFWGKDTGPFTFNLATEYFLRALGLIYAIAFFSALTQIKGLVGDQGILPASAFLNDARTLLGPLGWLKLPTLFWFSAGNGALAGVTLLAALVALLVLAGVQRLRTLLLTLLWFAYLSIVNIGQDFFSFQWDILLLETGFLALFLSSTRSAAILRLLCWWLLFRFMFSSGVVKILSGDETWRDLTALEYHYQTQPLPNPVAWYAHQLPPWVHHASVVGVLVIELLIPFFIFAPRRLRHVAGFSIVGLQTLIMWTGNYGFFNWLTIALCLSLFDDHLLRRFFSLKELQRAGDRHASSSLLKRAIVTSGAVLILAASSLAFCRTFTRPGFAWAEKALRWAQPFHLSSQYGLFAVMTTKRLEIIIEGSMDGETWKAYEFRYKPGDVMRSPPLIAPQHPRLDWQMWFAALEDYQTTFWVQNLFIRLLQGSHDVTHLLKTNPFSDAPPRFIRGKLFDYHFTNSGTSRQNRAWWEREQAGDYSPVLTLGNQ